MIEVPQKPEADLSVGTRNARLVAWLALTAIGGITYFFAAVAVLHVLRPAYNPITHAVSNYAIGPYGYLMTAAFFALALSLLALAFGLTQSMTLTSRARAGIFLLGIASAGMVVTGIFPGDVNSLHPPATTTAVVHWTAAGISFLSITIAAFLLSSCFKRGERWQSFQRPAIASAFAIVAALLVFGILVLIGWPGIGQRIYITTSLLWLLLTAVRLRSIATRGRH